MLSLFLAMPTPPKASAELIHPEHRILPPIIQLPPGRARSVSLPLIW